MAVIIVGDSPINRGDKWELVWTAVNWANPADGTGIITEVQVYVDVAPVTDFVIGIFYVVSGNNLTTRSHVAWGNIVGTGLQTLGPLNLPIVVGDYIGCEYTSGAIDRDIAGGAGLWFYMGLCIPCVNQAFNPQANHTLSLRGTGVTSGWTGKVSGVTNPAKVMGVGVANIAKVKGVA